MISRLLLLIGMAVSFAIAGYAQQESQVDAREALSQGVVAYRAANYEGAIEHFSRAVRLDPELTMAHLYLATAYAQKFVPGVDTPENVVWATRALSEYSEVLQRKPSDVTSLKGVAYLKLQLKDFRQAKESYQKAIAVDPNDPELFYAAGVADWSMAYESVMAEKAKLDAESGDALFLQPACTDARSAALANVEDGLAMLVKAISLRKDYDDAMAYMNLLYHLRADLECGNEQAHAADLKRANDWTEMALAARKRRAEAAPKSTPDTGADAPPQ
jgi:tetratricopeptide (TPR) repeat protein